MSEKKGLFGSMFRKKQKGSCCDMQTIEEKDSCCNFAASTPSATEGKTVIKVIGSGCAKCNKLTENTTQAANELGIDFELTKISDLMEIAATGVMQTPGLIINEKIVSTGKIPRVEEIKALLLEINS